MLTLGSALALLGLVALSIPVVIHLIRPQTGTPVWFGSIRLLKQLAVKQTRRTKIERWILLFLRIVIITVATLVMAQSLWQSADKFAPERLAILTPDWLAQADEAMIEAMAKDHDEVVLLDESQQYGAYWSRLAQLDKTRSAHYEFVVYGSKNLHDWWQTHRPVLTRPIQWQLLPPVVRDKTPKLTAAVIATNAEHSLLLTQALSELGFDVAKADNADVVIDLVGSYVATNAEQQVVKAASLLQSIQQPDLVYGVKQLLAPTLGLTHFDANGLDTRWLTTKVDENLYGNKQPYFVALNQYLLYLLLVLWALERVLAEYGLNWRRNVQEDAKGKADAS